MKFKIGKLEIIVFVGGMVVMILELIGSRLLAPYLGTSIFVWSSLIGIILGALSLGYYVGGKFSAKNPSLSFLLRVLLSAGILILFITIIKTPVLMMSMGLGVKFGSVVATLTLFALPSVILGMVSPYSIRLKIQNVESSGGVAGNLYALSTIGSIFGTFLAGFYLIPTFGSTQILFGLSLILILTSLIGGKRIFKLLLIIIVIAVWYASQMIPTIYIYEGDSAYNHIRVLDTEIDSNRPIRVLLLATEAHSIIYRDSDELASEYNKFYRLDNLFKPEIKKALTLGGGAYISPLDFISRHPESEMTVVEIDPEVTKTAKNYFKLKDNSRLKIFHQDGRIFLNNNTEVFDAIYGDAFASFFSIPFQLTTREAVEKIYNSLSDDGVFILNIISSLEGEHSKFFQAEYITLSEYFDNIFIFPSSFANPEDAWKHQNIMVFATKNNLLKKEDLIKNATDEQLELLKNIWEKEIIIEPKIKVLTDNFAPVDHYISKLL